MGTLFGLSQISFYLYKNDNYDEQSILDRKESISDIVYIENLVPNFFFLFYQALRLVFTDRWAFLFQNY